MFLYYPVVISLLLQMFVSSSTAIGEDCSLKHLETCGRIQLCKVSTNVNGTCQCMPGYTPDPYLINCVTNPPHTEGDDGGGSGGYVAAVIITLLLVVGACVAAVFLQQRYNLLVPMSSLCPTACLSWCPSLRLPNLNLFGVRSGRSRMMDDLGPADPEYDDPVV